MIIKHPRIEAEEAFLREIWGEIWPDLKDNNYARRKIPPQILEDLRYFYGEPLSVPLNQQVYNSQEELALFDDPHEVRLRKVILGNYYPGAEGERRVNEHLSRFLPPKYAHRLLMVHPITSSRNDFASIYGFEKVLEEPFLKVVGDYKQIVAMGGSEVMYPSPYGSGSHHLKAELFTSYNYQNRASVIEINSPRGYIISNDVGSKNFSLINTLLEDQELSVGGAVFGLCHRVASMGNEVKVNQYYPGEGVFDLWRERKSSHFRLNIPLNLVYVHNYAGEVQIGQGIVANSKSKYYPETEPAFMMHKGNPESNLLSEIAESFSNYELQELFSWYLPPRVKLDSGIRILFSKEDRIIREYGSGDRVFNLNLKR